MAVSALQFYPLHFAFRALDTIYFPPGKSGNILRGAFGLIFKRIADPDCYARIFEPKTIAGESPSGLANWPRPFVFRASHLDGRHIEARGEFRFEMNLFDVKFDSLPYFARAFAELANEGLGAGRGRAELIDAPDPQLTTIDLRPSRHAASVEIEFLTPTELKLDDGLAPQPAFGILFARLRDRIGTLSALYGAGPLDIDFKAIGERAASIRMTRCDLQHHHVSRRSSRTGQTHPLGGFTGVARYEGNLTGFLPFLEAGFFTGVGRQTSWGKGWMRVGSIA